MCPWTEITEVFLQCGSVPPASSLQLNLHSHTAASCFPLHVEHRVASRQKQTTAASFHRQQIFCGACGGKLSAASQTLQLMFNAAGRVGSRQQRPELNPALANMWTSAECCRDGTVMEDATSEEVTSHSVWVSEENSSSPSTGSGSPQQTETQPAIKKIKPVWLKLMQRLNWSYILSPSLPGSQ